MSVEEALVAEVKAAAAVAALVGARVFPQAAPQGTSAAYVTYETVAKRPALEHGGEMSLTEGRVSFLCHAPTYAAAKGTAAALLAALGGRRGTIQGVAFGAILPEEEADAGFDEELRMHVVAQDFRVWYG